MQLLNILLMPMLTAAEPIKEEITAASSMEKFWNALIGTFGKVWDLINANMPKVVNFFAEYWFLMFGLVLVLFFMVFKIFEKLLPAR